MTEHTTDQAAAQGRNSHPGEQHTSTQPQDSTTSNTVGTTDPAVSDSTAAAGDTPPPTSWWRRNRIGVLMLIPALVFSLGAAASRYVLVTYPNDYATAVTATDGTVSGGELPWWRTYGRSVTLPEVTIEFLEARELTAAEADGLHPAPGTRLWLLRTHWTADPETPLRGCMGRVVGSDEKIYTISSRYLAPSDPTLARMLDDNLLCVPAETPGPFPPSPWELDIADDTPARPAEWNKGMIVALPADVTPTELRIGMEPPAYFALPVTS